MSAKSKLATAADELTEEGIAILRKSLDQKTLIACKKCGFKNQHLDARAITAVLTFLNDYGHGKPATQKVAVEEPTSKTKKLEELSDEELHQRIKELRDGKADSGTAEEAAG